MACFANFCLLRAWWLVHHTIVCEKTVWCMVHKPPCAHYAKIAKTGRERTRAMLLGTNRCLVYVNPMINECWAINLEFSHPPNPIPINPPFFSFILFGGAQATMRAISKNWQNGPWEDTGNALSNKSLYSLCNSNNKWMLSNQSSKLFVHRKNIVLLNNGW